MTRFSTLASVAVVTLVLATGAASAFGPIGGLADTLNNGAGGGGSGGSANPGEPFHPDVTDAVITTPQEAMTDAILDGQNTIPINKIVLGGNKGSTNGKADIRKGDLVVALVCKVGAHDILTLRNAGATVPAGTKVRWDVASIGEHGVVRLQSDLGSGQAVRFDAAAGIDAGLPCAARTI